MEFNQTTNRVRLAIAASRAGQAFIAQRRVVDALKASGVPPEVIEAEQAEANRLLVEWDRLSADLRAMS